MSGTPLVVSDPVQLHHHNLLTRQFAEDRLQHSAELFAYTGCHEAQQSVGGLTHDVNSETLIITGGFQPHNWTPAGNLPQLQATI